MDNDEIIRKWIDVSIGGTPFHQYNDVKGGIAKGIDYPTINNLLNQARTDTATTILNMLEKAAHKLRSNADERDMIVLIHLAKGKYKIGV